MTDDTQFYEDTSAARLRAVETLDRAKHMHRRKRHELRIDERTTILVEKKNFNRAYAEAYIAKQTTNTLAR